MKRPPTKRRLVPVALLIVLLLTCSTVYAYMFAKSQTAETAFVPAQVSCKVSETFENNIKSSITVTNTGNIPAYVRVRLVTYWVDGEGNVAPLASPSLTVSVDESKWLTGSNNTFYYKTPVASEAQTSDLLNGGSIKLKTEEGYAQVVDVFAEAIQADPTKAVEESWNVTISVANEITGEKTT